MSATKTKTVETEKKGAKQDELAPHYLDHEDEEDPFESIRQGLPEPNPSNTWLTPPLHVPPETVVAGRGDDPNAEEEAPAGGANPRTLDDAPQLREEPPPKPAINRRMMLGIAAAAVLLLVFVFMPGSPKPKPQVVRTGDPASPLSMDGTHSQLNAGNDDTLGTPESQYPPQPQASIAAAAPSPEPSPPAPIPVPAPAPTPARDVDDFAIALRAGERQTKLTEKQDAIADLQSLAQPSPSQPHAAPADSHISLLPEGVHLSLVLKEPFRSGIASSISAQVVDDASGSDKQLLVPRGSIASITFLPYEVNQRVLNDRHSPILIVTPEGKRYRAVGVIKGADGFAGLTGKVKTIGRPSVLHRIGTTAVGTASRIGAGQVGAYSPEVEDEIARDSYQYNGGSFDRSSRIVEVPANTKCSLVVTSEAAK